MHDAWNGTPSGRWALLPIRLVLGCGFMVHGWAKLMRGPAGFAKLLDWIGVPHSWAAAWATTLLELLGGLALLSGSFVATVSVPLVVVMLMAMFAVHLRNGFSSINTTGLTAAGPQFGPPGYEVNLLYVAGLLALLSGGAGPWSVDGWRARARDAGDAENVSRARP